MTMTPTATRMPNRPVPGADSAAAMRRTPRADLVPPTWLDLPEGPERIAAARRWMCDEMRARGVAGNGRLFAAAWCPEWLGPPQQQQQRMGAAPNRPAALPAPVPDAAAVVTTPDLFDDSYDPFAG